MKCSLGISNFPEEISAAAAAKSLQSCPTLWDPIDGNPHPWDSPGKNTGVGCHFLLQCMKVKSESEVAQSVQPSATPWTAAFQAPPSMGFSRQEYWSGVPLPSLEEISSLFHSVVFLYFFALIAEAFLSLLAILWNSAFKWKYLSFSPLLFASLLFTVPKI